MLFYTIYNKYYLLNTMRLCSLIEMKIQKISKSNKPSGLKFHIFKIFCSHNKKKNSQTVNRVPSELCSCSINYKICISVPNITGKDDWIFFLLISRNAVTCKLQRPGGGLFADKPSGAIRLGHE